ncbi:Flp pilus assembly protein CpaB [Defluviimonas sp. WL0050]|uniref:Flp pilus assembly protein CpaB n=1 Tax=Albidovulum litorale TaxID=2984134 RepID=A0ABT2ZIA9_9RHOB|nr:Flp pilus assembly protein CpaB [Defluviimonas sp. WL0050]MCV2870872.1 Flp pilus assembly protein CpaB [Defluviimonas sp. WL0050]
MGARSILVALLGIAVAGGSAFAAREYLDRSSAVASTDPEAALVSVIVAGHDIPFGQPIQANMLQVMSWPRAALPPGAITDLDVLVAQPGMPPRRATRAMSQGELILASKISEFGEKVTIVQTLGANTRAMAISVDAQTAVGGFVTPGDSVDIVLTQGGGDGLRAITILQNIRIIGVDQQADEQSDQPSVARTVTVEVTPEQSQTLALAQKAGTLSLSLRTLDSAIDEPLDSIRLSDILRDKSPVDDPAEAKATIRVRRANEVEDVEVD